MGLLSRFKMPRRVTPPPPPPLADNGLPRIDTSAPRMPNQRRHPAAIALGAAFAALAVAVGAPGMYGGAAVGSIGLVLLLVPGFNALGVVLLAVGLAAFALGAAIAGPFALLAQWLGFELPAPPKPKRWWDRFKRSR